MFGPLLFDATGRIRNTTSAPTAFNAGVGSVGGLLSAAVAAVSHYSGGLPFTANGSLAIAAGAPTHYSNGLPFTAAGALAIDTAGAITHSSGGLPFTAAGRIAFATAGALTFVQEMGVVHVLTAGTNDANRRGYRRNFFGAFTPDDVPLLNRLFSNTANNRLIVQATGDVSALPVDGITIRHLPLGVPLVFGPPNSQVFDGVFTDFLWIIPGFDFVDGQQYEVSLQ